MNKNYFIGALIFLALTLLIWGIGIPATLIFNQLGYSSNVFITFIEFNGIGFVDLAISIILFIKNSDKKKNER